MNWLWPHNLWWMLALASLPLLYLWLLRRRRQQVLTLPSLHLVRQAVAVPSWRRHLPPALMFVALALLVLATARPTARLSLPWAKTTVLLAMDVSLSMRVQDVKPTRMRAAQDAAKTFLGVVPPRIEVGLVSFAGTAHVAQRATTDRESLLGAVEAIQMQMGTAIGSGIVLCLAELFPEHGIDLQALHRGQRPGAARWPDAASPAPPKAITPVAPASYDAAAIILLSDGRRTMGVDTLEAAQMAADRGVRIDVIGLGTPDGHLAEGEGMAIYLQLDEPTLRQVAKMTGGEYHQAASAEALRRVYQNLGSRVELRRRETELSGLLAAAAALLLLAGAGLSLLWFGRVL